MTTRQLLYVGTGHDQLEQYLIEQSNWEISRATTLTEASQKLRAIPYLVGLLHGVIGTLRTREVDQFLRAHSQVYWVGIVDAATLASEFCRDLIADHLYDYHSEPISLRRLADTIGHVYGWARLRQGRPMQKGPDSRQVGTSAAMVRLREQVARVARTSAPVLIWGESGSGKELAAQAIHEQSPRICAPFIAVNCGAVAPNLIQSELFGHEKGAFTGAIRQKIGLLEAANGGTIFLDEIADLPKELQATLLRFLQEKVITRLGAIRATPLNVRVIAASHVNLQDAVEKKEFREDLYYRLAVLPVNVPPLRERRDDLMLLADHFFAQYSEERQSRLKGFSSSAVNAILTHAWPGNVRELMNRVRRAIVMTEGHLISAADLGFLDPTEADMPRALDDTLLDSERLAIQTSLTRSGQNISRAAQELGVSRTTMYRLLNKHNIRI